MTSASQHPSFRAILYHLPRENGFELLCGKPAAGSRRASTSTRHPHGPPAAWTLPQAAAPWDYANRFYVLSCGKGKALRLSGCFARQRQNFSLVPTAASTRYNPNPRGKERFVYTQGSFPSRGAWPVRAIIRRVHETFYRGPAYLIEGMALPRGANASARSRQTTSQGAEKS